MVEVGVGVVLGLKAGASGEMELVGCRGGVFEMDEGKVDDGGGRATYGERALLL